MGAEYSLLCSLSVIPIILDFSSLHSNMGCPANILMKIYAKPSNVTGLAFFLTLSQYSGRYRRYSPDHRSLNFLLYQRS